MTKRFILVLVGLCFFFNPYFAAIDVLPDFIGCLLIAIGLIPLSRISLPMKEAQRSFLILALIDAAKQVLLLFVFGNSALGEQEVLLLIVAFLSATLGTVFAVHAMRTLFNGLAWFADTYECESLCAVKRQGRSRTELFARFTVFFVIAKEAILLLPEFAALLNSTYADSDLVRLYNYIGLMRALAVIPVAILGFYWLCALIVYFCRLLREKVFLQALNERYVSFMEEHPGTRVKARYFVAFCLIATGLFFLTDFYLDYWNIIPDTVGGCLILCGVLLLGISRKVCLPAVLSAVLYTVVANISSHKSYLFVSEHVGGDISRSEAVAKQYQIMWMWSLAELFCFLVLLLFLILALRAVLIKWGGYLPEHADVDFEARHELKIREEFDWQFIKCYIFGFLSALLSFFFDYFKTWPNTESLRYFSRFMEGLWVPDFILAIFFAVYMSYTLTLAFAKIGERFMFE